MTVKLDDIKILVKDAWKLDKDLVDEINISDQETLKTFFGDKKTKDVAATTFKSCKTLEDFHKVTQKNILSLEQAAIYLIEEGQGKTRSISKLLPNAQLIVQIAKKKSPKLLNNLGNSLKEYASHLQEIYSKKESDIKKALSIETKDLKKDSWIREINQEYNKSKSRKTLATNINSNLSHIKLMDAKGETIEIEPYKGTNFVDYLTNILLPTYMAHLGMTEEGESTEILLNLEGKGFLNAFKAFTEGKKSAQEAAEGFSGFINHLIEDSSKNSKKLVFLFTAISSQIGQTVHNKLSQLTTAASDKKAVLNERSIDVLLDSKQPLEIHIHDIYSPEKSGNETSIALNTEVQLDPDSLIAVKTNCQANVLAKTSTKTSQDIAHYLDLAEFDTQLVTPEEEVALVNVDPAQTFKVRKDVSQGLISSTIQLLERLIYLTGSLKIPPKQKAQFLARRAYELDKLLPNEKDAEALELLKKAYGVKSGTELPKGVRDALVDMGKEVTSKPNQQLMKDFSSTCNSLGTKKFKENYLLLANHFADAMTLTPTEWNQITKSVLKHPKLLTNIERQLKFLGFHHLHPEELKTIMDTALVTGIIKGTNPEDLNIIRGFMETHGDKAFGALGVRRALEAPVSPETRRSIEKMRVKEMEFAKMCLDYDKYISHFSDVFRKRTLELLELIVDFRKKIHREKDASLQKIANKELATMEPFQGDYYQGSIPVNRIIDALKNPDTNFRVLMWICANMDDLFEKFFTHQETSGKMQIDTFENFLKKEHPKVDWISFEKIRAQFKASKRVQESFIHRRELDEQKGLSLFHPRHPLTAHSRETPKYRERISRKKVRQSPKMKEEQKLEEFLRANDVSQQQILPLSLEEVERHNPELYAKLSKIYNLKTKNGHEAATQSIAAQTVKTRWKSGGWVWAMNEGTLIDKKNPKVEYAASPLTMMLTRSVPMVGGISGHIEFVLHLATYFGMNKQDALIATFANLVMCNAHTIPEIVIGCSNFMEVIPSSVLAKIEFNETMVPTLTKWVMDRIPKAHPFRKHMKSMHLPKTPERKTLEKKIKKAEQHIQRLKQKRSRRKSDLTDIIISSENRVKELKKKLQDLKKQEAIMHD